MKNILENRFTIVCLTLISVVAIITTGTIDIIFIWVLYGIWKLITSGG